MATRDRSTVQGELNTAQEELRILRRDDAAEATIETKVQEVRTLAAELAAMVRLNLQKLQQIPAYSVTHGQAIDVRANLAAERLLLRELNAIVEGRSVYQGPDVEV